MSESGNRVVGLPGSPAANVLTSLLRSGPQRMLAEAIEAEVSGSIECHRHLTNEAGHRQVVRNGYAPKGPRGVGSAAKQSALRSSAT